VKVQLEEKSSSVIKLTIEISPDEIAPELNRKYEEYRKKAKIEGFRKGKTPLALIKKIYGKEIEMVTVDELIQQYYSKALEEQDIVPVSKGTVDDVEYEPEKFLRFVALVEVEPSFEIGDISGLKATKEVRKITDENVNQEIERIRFSLATKESVDTPSEVGDFILADIQQIDPSTKIPIIGKKWEERYFKLGDDMLGIGEEFEQELVGLKAGETCEIEHEYPEDFHDKSLAGQKVLYVVDVKNVEKIDLPPLDDELAKDANVQCETLDELRNLIRTNLEQYVENQAKQNLQRQLEDDLISRYDFDLPPNMVEEYITNIIKHARKESEKPVDEAYLKNLYRPEAVRYLRWHFIRKKLIDEKDLKATENEINARIDELAEQQNMEKEKALLLLKSKKNKERIEEQIIEEKIQDLLNQSAEITVNETV